MAGGGPVATGWHLARRFAGSLSTRPPSDADDAWARGHLSTGEHAIWERMSNPDRRHAIGVARAVVDTLGGAADRPVVAAALLHDSGKVVSGLGTFARVGATLWWAVADTDWARRWAAGPAGIRRQLGQYRLHPELGRDLLTEAGSDPLTAAWAAEHHRSPDHWTIPAGIATVLKSCDDD